MTGDLFGVPDQAEAMPLALCGKSPPKICVSFACACGARDEVVAPAPDRVDCWSCKAALSMRQWLPQVPAPAGNARMVTDAERARLPVTPGQVPTTP